MKKIVILLILIVGVVGASNKKLVDIKVSATEIANINVAIKEYREFRENVKLLSNTEIRDILYILPVKQADIFVKLYYGKDYLRTITVVDSTTRAAIKK